MMQLGDIAEVSRTFSATDLTEFAALTGAEPTDTVPGPLIAALFSYLLGVKLPGPGTNYLKQEVEFLNDLPLDTLVRATVQVVRLREDKQIADLWAQAELPDGTVVGQGRSLVKYADTIHGQD